MRLPAIAKRLAGGLARWRGVLGLTYHRVGDGRASMLDRGLWSVTPEDLDRQVRYLKANFDIISPRDIAYVVRVKRGRHVVLTFDDGYADNYTAGFPIFRAHDVPATFFVATGFIDAPSLPWWDDIAWMVRASKRRALSIPPFFPAPIAFDEPDREQAVRAVLRRYKQLPDGETAGYLEAVAEATGTGRAPPGVTDVRGLWMTWDMLREMQRAGMTIGGHTSRHCLLSRLSRAEQADEIASCARRIEEELGVKMRAFAYPVGARDSFNRDSRECLREQGVVAAFSYYGGLGRLDDWDDLDIPRISVEQDTTFAQFRAMLSWPWGS